MMRSMKPALVLVIAAVLLGLWAVSPDQVAAQAPARTVSTSTGQGMAAIDTAARNGKYLFIFFWKTNDDHNQKMSDVFQSAMKKWAESAESIGIQITDPKEKSVVDKFGVSRAPMPLVIALAPNGAITKGFAAKFTEQQLQQGFVSPGTARCMKALQNDKLVLLCVQNEQTQNNAAASKGVSEFKADKRYAKAFEVVTLNPADRAEATFLQALQVDPKTAQAVTVLLAPPGKPIAKFTGAVSKDQIVAKVKAGPCASGQCGPGGCGPKK